MFHFHTYKLEKPTKSKSDTKFDQTMGFVTLQSRSKFKIRQLLVLQIAATFTANCGSWFITKQSSIYWKMLQLLQNKALISKWATRKLTWNNFSV